MATNIEKLQTRVEETNNQIEQIEQTEWLSEAQKLQKAKDLEAIISIIESDLDLLRKDATAEVLLEIAALDLEISNLNKKFELAFKDQLDDLKTEIGETSSTNPEKKESPEEEKWWFWTQFDGLTSKDEWKNHTWKNIARVAGWLWIARLWSKLVKWIWSLFSSKEKPDSEKKGFWDKRYWKALKRTWVWFWWFAIWKNWDSISGWFNWLFGNKEDDPKWWWAASNTNTLDIMGDGAEGAVSFEDLKENNLELADEFTKVWDGVNSFYDKVYSFNDGTISVPEKSKLWEWKEKYSGAIPNILDNSFKSIDEIQNRETIFTLCAYGNISVIQAKFGELVSTGAWKLVESILSLFGFDKKFDSSDVKEYVQEFIWWWEEKNVNMIFRKILKIMSYTNYAENVVLWRKIDSEINNWWKIYKIDWDIYEEIDYSDYADEDKLDLINSIQENPELYKIWDEEASVIISEFTKKSLNKFFVEEPVSLEEIMKYNVNINKHLKKYNEKRDVACESLNNWNKEKVLNNMKGQAEKEIYDWLYEKCKKMFTPLNLANVFYDDSAIRKMIKEDAWFKKMIQDYHLKFDSLKNETDISKVKKSIDDYYSTVKELYVTQDAINEMVDENWDIVSTMVIGIKNSFTWIPYTFVNAYKAYKKWDYIESIAWWYGWSASVAVMWNAIWLNRGIPWLLVKWFGKVAAAPFKIINLALGKSIKYWALANAIPSYAIKWAYTSVSAIQQWITNWLSANKAWKLYQYLPESSGMPWSKFVFDVLWVRGDNVDVVTKILFDGSGERMTKSWRIMLKEIINRPGIFSAKKWFTIDIAEEIISKYSQITKINTITTATEGLWDVANAVSTHSNLYSRWDDINNLARKILDKWNIADWADYFDNPNQISRAKAYAEKILNKKRLEWWLVVKSWRKAKNMFKQATSKIRSLFISNPKVSPSMKTWIESNLATIEDDLANVSADVIQDVSNWWTPKPILKKIFSNPIFKRVLQYIPLLVDVWVSIYRFYTQTKQADEIKKTNEARWGVKQEEANFNLTLWWVSATITAIGVANIWNPWGWVILWITAGIETVRFAGTQYYEVINSYYRNFEDFKRMCMAYIKQEIISKESWESWIEISLQEKFQEMVWNFFLTNSGWQNKKNLSLNTKDEAIRALIRLEETENYPYSCLDSNNFTADLDIYEEIRKQKEEMKSDASVRFDFIKKQYWSDLVTDNDITDSKAKRKLDEILFLSRQHLVASKDEKTSIDDYKNIKLEELKKNSNFDKLENLYVSNELEFHKIIKSLPYFGFLFNQQDPLFYENYDLVKNNMDYVVKYYNYKTLWMLPSDLPAIEIDWDNVDYAMIEKFFVNFELNPSGFDKSELPDMFKNNQLEIITPTKMREKYSVSESVWQNIFYRIASEVLWWYNWNNDIDDLKLYYNEGNKEKNWIYYSDWKWRINQTSTWYSNTYYIANLFWIWPDDRDKSFATDEELNDVSKINVFENIVSTLSSDPINNWTMIDTDTWTWEKAINKEYWILINSIVNEELEYRNPTNIEQYKNEAVKYINDNSNGKYIHLSLDIITKLTKAWIYNTWYYYYKSEWNHIKALQSVKWTVPDYLKANKNWLTNNIEIYNISKIELAPKTKDLSWKIDDLVNNVNSLIISDWNDLSLHKDTKSLIKKNVKLWNEFKKDLSYMDYNLAEQKMSDNYENYKSIFENIYVSILHLASSWSSSNDVDDYGDYMVLNPLSKSDLIGIYKESSSKKIKINIHWFEYVKEFNDMIYSYKSSNDWDRTVSELINGSDKEAEKWQDIAKVILKSVLESVMISFDDSWKIDEIKWWWRRSFDKDLCKERIEYNISKL